jgi:hypothetical protein
MALADDKGGERNKKNGIAGMKGDADFRNLGPNA